MRCKIPDEAKVVATLVTNEAQQITCLAPHLRGNRGTSWVNTKRKKQLDEFGANFIKSQSLEKDPIFL